MSAMRVAVAGCGRMGHERAQHIASFGATIVAAFDTDLERCMEFGIRTGARPMASPHDFAWDSLDAVFICTPPAERLEYALMARDAEVAVFLEKPLALTAADGATLVDIVRASSRPSAVGYMNRYRAGIALARRTIASEAIHAIAAHWGSRRYGVPWWNDKLRSGGPINEQATHLVDLCRYIAGDAETVCAVGSGDEARAAIALHYRSGAVGTLLYTCETNEKHIGLHVVGANGALQFDGWDFRMTLNSMTGEMPEQDPNPFETETHAFLSSVQTGDTTCILCTPEDALATQQLVDRIRAAISATCFNEQPS